MTGVQTCALPIWNVLRTQNTSEYCSLEYFLYAPEDAYYDVYIYAVPKAMWADSAHYVMFSDSLIFDGADQTSVYYDQSNRSAKGWQKLGTTFLTQGEKRVLKLDNATLQQGDYLFADAAMLMINRKIKVEQATKKKKKKQTIHPSRITLLQNYPNPFNPTTTLRYVISSKHMNDLQHVRLKVYDARGQKIAELVNEQESPGEYRVAFHGEDLPSGIYLYKLEVGSETTSRKMLLVK